MALRIAEGLAAFRDPETGRRPVSRVYRAQDIYAGPHRGEGPDLVVACDRGYRVGNQTAVGGVGSRVVEPNLKQWSGDHIVAPSVVPAVIMANVPLQLEGATAYDVAPTAMSLLGLSMPECDGRPLPPRAASTA